jgi:DNA-binding MarR family transcriptional regulator
VAQPGYIYVLANPSTKGIVKIGKTRQNPLARAKMLSSASGVPTPFIVVYQAHFEDSIQAEQFVHAKLAKFRVSNNREFFQVEIPIAVDAVIEAKNNFGRLENDLGATNHGENKSSDEFDSVAFGTIQEPEKGLYELLDIFMSRSMHGWNHFVKSIGLSMPQFSILLQLYYRGDFSISEISERFGISVPAASQLVEKLVQSGYLERAEHPTDRRARLLPLSAKGKKLIEQGFKQRYRWLDELMRTLSTEEKDKVNEALRFLTEAAREVEKETNTQVHP